MKARLLKKLLNNTTYIVHYTDSKICVGGRLCHELLHVEKATFKVRYKLDTFHEGRKSLNNEKLLEIWDKLHELIENGQLNDIMDGKDELENPLPVFSVKNGEVIKSLTDAYGYPNITDDGILMYENTHFPTEKQALENAIEEYKAGVRLSQRRIHDIEKDLDEMKNILLRENLYLESVKKQLNETS